MFTGGITTGEQGAAGSACTRGDRDAESGAGPEVEPRWQVVLRLLEDNARTRVKLEAIESELILEADACYLHRHLGSDRSSMAACCATLVPRSRCSRAPMRSSKRW